MGTFIAVADPQPGAGVEAMRREIQDDTPVFRPAERAIWFHELARVRNTSDEELRKESLGAVPYLLMHKQPRDYRGQVVTVKGTVRQAYRSPAIANDLGVAEYCVYVIQPVGQADSVVWVYGLSVPEGFPRLGTDQGDPRGKMREDVEVTGIFFKRCAYPAQGGTYTAPVLVANRPRWQAPVDVAASPTMGRLELAGAMLGTLLVAICIAAVLWKRTGRSRRVAASADSIVNLRSLEVGPTTQERLREMERQAREGVS